MIMSKLVVLLIALVTVLMQCSGTSSVQNHSGGGASETVASVIRYRDGCIITVKGDPGFMVNIAICSDSFSVIDTEYYHQERLLSGPEAIWTISNMDSGRYHVFITDTVNHSVVMLHYNHFAMENQVPDTLPLVSAGMIKGTVSITADSDSIPILSDITVYLVGTFFAASTDNLGNYEMFDVPEGTFTINVSKPVRTYIKSNNATTVTVSGDATSVVDFELSDF